MEDRGEVGLGCVPAPLWAGCVPAGACSPWNGYSIEGGRRGGETQFLGS